MVQFGIGSVAAANHPEGPRGPKDAENFCNGCSQKPWLGPKVWRLLLECRKIGTGCSSPDGTVGGTWHCGESESSVCNVELYVGVGEVFVNFGKGALALSNSVSTGGWHFSFFILLELI